MRFVNPRTILFRIIDTLVINRRKRRANINRVLSMVGRTYN
jgi:hypothetical protein